MYLLRVFRHGLLTLFCVFIATAAFAQSPATPGETGHPATAGRTGRTRGTVRAARRPARKRRRLGADAAGARGQDARHGEGHAEDFVMDLGSGDGRTVITAAKRGVKAMGVEYNPDMVALSKKAAAKEGVGDRATFVQADLFKTDLSKATVITMFLLPSINMQLRPSIAQSEARHAHRGEHIHDGRLAGRRDRSRSPTTARAGARRCCGSCRRRCRAHGKRRKAT